jgi:hypothetical protein
MSQINTIRDIIQDYISNPLVWTNDDNDDGILISKDIPIQVLISGYPPSLSDYIHTIHSSQIEDIKRKIKAGWRIYFLSIFNNAMAMIQYDEKLFDTIHRRVISKNDYYIDIPIDIVPFVYYFTEQDGMYGQNMPDFDKTKLVIQ